jgi:Ca-activated chloride channel family protein
MNRLYPRKAPDLFQSDQLTFALRLKGDETQKALLTLTGTSKGKPLSHTKSIPLQATSRPWVGRMWAQERVNDLLEQMSLQGETPELKNETIELALAYNLVTRYTSFLAIPESEISDDVRGSIDEERKRRSAILKKHKDAAALSRSLMPPGDPLLSVRAPHDALGVTAVFPFGLTLDLSYCRQTEQWEGRFLVPNDVGDGSYSAKIFVVDRSGELSETSASYEIDSQAPGFTVGQTTDADGVRLIVEGDEDLREVRVEVLKPTSPDFASSTAAAEPSTKEKGNFTKESSLRFSKRLVLPPGIHQLRIVVTDLARNESVRIITVRIDDEGNGA